MWNNVYDVDKRHPATVVKPKKPGLRIQKKQVLSGIGEDPDYQSFLLRKTLKIVRIFSFIRIKQIPEFKKSVLPMFTVSKKVTALHCAPA